MDRSKKESKVKALAAIMRSMNDVDRDQLRPRREEASEKEEAGMSDEDYMRDMENREAEYGDPIDKRPLQDDDLVSNKKSRR